MRIKTYIAATLSEAMQQVRKELGDEAVIVSTLEGEEEVRVTAALEKIEAMTGGEQPLHSPLSNKLPGLELICDRLELHNLPMELSELLIEDCSMQRGGDVAQRLVKSLEHNFYFTPFPTFETALPPTLLIGPPGVGKTVTIAKLALRAHVAGNKVHVITADAQKAGAVSQITSFAKALSLSIATASTQEELTIALDKAPPNTTLLIDTPGINPFKKDEMRELAEIILAVRVAPVLILPAGGDVVEQKEMIESFATLGAGRLILTKMDFSRRLGGLLAAIHQTRIQMMAYGNSPMVAQPLHELTPEQLALLLLDDLICQDNGLTPHKESA